MSAVQYGFAFRLSPEKPCTWLAMDEFVDGKTLDWVPFPFLPKIMLK
jgi:hypothetical protein